MKTFVYRCYRCDLLAAVLGVALEGVFCTHRSLWRTIMNAAAFVCFLIVVCPASAQTITLTRITDLTTPVHGAGDRPALDDGMVAFLGQETATGLWGIYMTSADGSGSLTLIADQNTPIPNVPGETFLELDNPEIQSGVVGFTGGFETGFIDKHGIYLGSGGPLTVYYDAVAAQYNPQPFAPVIEGSDLVFSSINPDSSDQHGVPYYMPSADVADFVGGELPGGGDSAALTPIGDNPGLGGGQVVLSADVLHENVFDGAVYTWSVIDQTFDLVANWNTEIPGQPLFFDNFGSIDTDGNNVVFRGGRGLLGFGGHQGLYLAPVGAGGTGPFTTVAEIGQIAPGGTASFAAFGNVAIEGDLVIFEAFLGSASNPSGQGIYGWRNGMVFKVIDNEDIVDGQEILGATMNFRGLDSNQLAIRITFLNPQHPNFHIDFGIYIAEITDGKTLLGDVNLDGVVDLLDVGPFVNLLTTGGFQAEADINQDGVVDLLDVSPFVQLLSGG